MPALRVEVLYFALPFDKVPVPNSVLPSLNVTVPVGVVVGEVTVAVNVTFCSGLEGLTEEATLVAEVAIFTFCFKSADVLFASAASPA